MIRSVFLLLLLAGSLALAPRAAAAQDAATETARVAFEKGQALFVAGNFAEAAASFEAAYAARPFPQFLFNIGACHEKLGDYPKAVEQYKKYLAAAPGATDRKKTEKRIEALEKAIEELAAAAAATPPVDPNAPPVDPNAPPADPNATPADPNAPPADPNAPPATPPAPAAPPKALAGLDAAGLKGVVVIESDPPNANIYLDSKKGRPFAKTPWNGELTGEHTLYLEREGYKPVERKISPAGDKYLEVIFSMAEEDYLGWVNITSNPPGADIYIDDKSVGVYNRTPFQGNLPPGKHKIWVTKEGYDEFFTEVDLAAADRKQIVATLSGAPVGYLHVRGRQVEKAAIYLDGKLLCERGPCIKPVKEGEHTVTLKREGYKAYSTTIDVQPKTETTVRAQLAEKPSRTDAVVAYLFAGAFIGAGVWAGREAQALEDDLSAEIAAGSPPPDDDDPRFLRGKLFAVGADTAYVLGGASLLAAVYYTLRDKGAPSTGTTDVRAIAVTPALSPEYAGVGMEVRW